MSSSQSTESESSRALRLPFACAGPAAAAGAACGASWTAEAGPGALTSALSPAGGAFIAAAAAAEGAVLDAKAAGFCAPGGFFSASNWPGACSLGFNTSPSSLGLETACFSGLALLGAAASAAAGVVSLCCKPLLLADAAAGCADSGAAGALLVSSAVAGSSRVAALAARRGAEEAAAAALRAGDAGDLGIRPFSGADTGRASPKGLVPPGQIRTGRIKLYSTS